MSFEPGKVVRHYDALTDLTQFKIDYWLGSEPKRVDVALRGEIAEIPQRTLDTLREAIYRDTHSTGPIVLTPKD